MDINKTYNNPKLELRRQDLIRTAQAEAVLRRRKRRAFKPRVEIQQAMRGKPTGALGSGILNIPRIRNAVRRRDIAHYEQFFLIVDDRSAMLAEDEFRSYLPALGRLLEFRSQWLRGADNWRPGTHNTRRQFASLARHLLANYDMPRFFDDVWFEGSGLHQAWYAHVGQGGNLRRAEGLPIPLTKMMAHHAMTSAPGGCSLLQAIRYGQARALGVEERLARAVLGSRIGNAFAQPEPECFWSMVLGFFAKHPMIDPNQIGPIIDYLHHQRFVPAAPLWIEGMIVTQGPAQPGLSMRGRDPVTLIGQVEAWHRRLVHRTARDFNWQPCGLEGYERIEGEQGNQRRFTVTELLDTAELRAEGKAMRHCVATYGFSCQSGRVAIFSMKVADRHGEQKLLTIEVDVRNRQIVQARGRFNTASTPLDQRIMNAWATVAGLKFGRFALTRAW